jgi:hypothetical protein
MLLFSCKKFRRFEMHTTTCPVAHIATEALSIIRRRDAVEDAELTHLAELEERAIQLAPSSRVGLLFQAALITTLVDCIDAAVPAGTKWATQSARHLQAIDRISRQIVASLASSPATADERDIADYYLPRH